MALAMRRAWRAGTRRRLRPQLDLGRFLDHVAEIARERLAELGTGALSLVDKSVDELVDEPCCGLDHTF